MAGNWEQKRALTDKELEQEMEKLFQEEYENLEDNISDYSGSEVEDLVESESDYMPSDEDDRDDNQPGASKRRKILKNITEDVRGTDDTENVQAGEKQHSISEVRLKGKDGHRWSSVAKTETRTLKRNIIHIVQGPKDLAKAALTHFDTFSLFITESMIDTIVKYTNTEIDVRSKRYKDEKATISETSATEIKALLGLLYFSAAMKNNHLPTSELFNDKLCGTNYSSAMSEARCKFLINCLRFDDKDSRDERKQSDAFAAVREIWDELIEHCKDLYKPGSYVTIDEQLLGFRGRCPFRMYIPNKPSKYGLKIVMVCDVSTKYMINATPYLGKSTQSNGMPLGEYFVKTLTEPIYRSNRNITMDNWFTSIKIADDLLKSPYNLTIVGTIRSNKREIPPEMLNLSKRPVGHSKFCFDNEKTLVSYKAKSNKNVLLLSTMHAGNSNIGKNTGKPEIIECYNMTKGAVDTFDQMCGHMNTSRKTKRWPLCIFYGMLNIAGINAYVLYCYNNIKIGKKPITRREFLMELHKSLIEPWLRQRIQIKTLQSSIRKNIENLLPKTIQDKQTTPEPAKRSMCYICPTKKRRMTTHFCNRCKQPYCSEHRASFCDKCVTCM